MDLEEMRIFINAIANKDATGNNMTPDEYNSYLARANEDKFRLETGIRESQTPIYFQSGQLSTDALSPFLKRGFSLSGTSGIFTIPNDYRHTISLFYTDSTGRQRIITALNVNEFDAIIDNDTKSPSNEYPYATQYGDSIEVAPSTINTLRLTYLIKPVIPVWGFTVINDEPIYNPGTSVQLQWRDIYHIDIARIILGYLGANFRDQDLYQIAETQKKQGI